MPAGDQSGHDCGVHPRTAGNSVADLRGRDLGCLAARSSDAPREPAGGLRSAKGRPVERGEQERPDRCAKVGRVKEGNKSDRIDARKLAEMLRTNQLKSVYHGEHGLRTLKELGRSYLTITQDVTRSMNRIKALYRSWAIPCAGTSVYAPRHRAEWLAKIEQPGVRIRAERLYQQLDSLQPLRLQARCELLRESHQHAAVQLLRQIPSIGPIRSALLMALLQTPHRFRTKRQLWAYSGFAVETHDSGEYRSVRGKLQRNRERITVRGLNDNHNKDLKNLFKSAAISASTRP